jgi:hypothetical protein
MSTHGEYIIDKKTKLNTTLGLQWSILVCVFATGVFMAGIYFKMDNMLTRDQMQVWVDELREANTPWHNHIVVPSIPGKTSEVGRRAIEQVQAED